MLRVRIDELRGARGLCRHAALRRLLGEPAAPSRCCRGRERVLRARARPRRCLERGRTCADSSLRRPSLRGEFCSFQSFVSLCARARAACRRARKRSRRAARRRRSRASSWCCARRHDSRRPLLTPVAADSARRNERGRAGSPFRERALAFRFVLLSSQRSARPRSWAWRSRRTRRRCRRSRRSLRGTSCARCSTMRFSKRRRPPSSQNGRFGTRPLSKRVSSNVWPLSWEDAGGARGVAAGRFSGV